MTPRTWVVGSGGLLGSAVVRHLRATAQPVFDGPPIRWSQQSASDDLAVGLRRLVGDGGAWQVVWCAGVTVTSSDPSELDTEQKTFGSFIDAVAGLSESERENGSIVFASSAGAVYGGSVGAPFDERSPTAPLGRYGAAKLQAEDRLRGLGHGSGVRVLIARIANVYGPGQDIHKQQGLVSRLCLASLTRTPVPIFVPLDTLRDYIFVDDCAALIVACGQRLGSLAADDRVHTKVICSGVAVSVAAVLSHTRQAGAATPAVIMATSPSSALHSSDLRLVSRYWTDLDTVVTTTLPAGIGRTIEDMRRTWLQPGRLASSSRWE